MRKISYDGYFWQNELVRLRAVQEHDWEDNFHNYFDSNARRLLQYELELPPTVSGAKAGAAKFSDFAPGTGRLMFTVERLDGTAVGGMNLNSINERNGTFSIGMQIHREHRGRGYGTAGMRILLKYAFYERRLNKYYGSVLEGNIASAKMLKKLGCAEEGRRREMIYMDGRYHDEVLFGLTRKDFERIEPPRAAAEYSRSCLPRGKVQRRRRKK